MKNALGGPTVEGIFYCLCLGLRLSSRICGSGLGRFCCFGRCGGFGRRGGGRFRYREIEALHEAALLQRADIAAYHSALIDQQICLHHAAAVLIPRVIQHVVCPPLGSHALIKPEVKPLSPVHLGV